MTPMLPPDQVVEIARVAKEAAAQGEGSQMLYLILIGVGLLGAVAKYFSSLHTKVSERLDKVQDDTNAYMREGNVKLIGCIERQTEMHEKLVQVLEPHLNLIKK